MRKEYPGRYVIRVLYPNTRATQIRSTASDDLRIVKLKYESEYRDKPQGGYWYASVYYDIYDKQESRVVKFRHAEEEEERRKRMDLAAQRINSDPPNEDET